MTRQKPSIYAYADMKIDLPSFALPGRSGYRGFVPKWQVHAIEQVARIDLVHTHSLFFAGRLARMTARVRHVPLILTYHTMLEAYSHYAGIGARPIRAWLRRYTRRFANTTDVVTVPTLRTAEYLRKAGVTGRIEIIPSGIDTTAFDTVVYDEALASTLRCTHGDALILCVARLGKEKNLELLLEAVACMRRPVTVMLAGSGPQRKHLQRIAQQFGIAASVRFLGVLDRAALAAVYRVSDCFAFPSTTETQGLVLAEALYAELPVVVVDTPQGREVVAGSDARLVAPNAVAFAQAIEEVLATPVDADLQAARKRSGARYDRRVTSARMAELYRELLASTQGKQRT